MPIVDGLTSTKMIRSFEKTHTDILSVRAKHCGRIPIIAVSASLLEKNKQMYIDAGFDAWILKPISFARLSELMAAIVKPDLRKDCLYKPGEWERGGWFHLGEKSPAEVNTAPSNKPPQSNPPANVEEAASSDDPTAGADSEDARDQEQQRLLQEQAKGKGKDVHEDESSDDTTPRPTPAGDAPPPSE